MDALSFNDDNKERIEVKPAEGVPTSDLSAMDDEFGHQEVVPRVGDEYQAEIPSLVAASQLIKKLKDSNMPESSSMRSSVPLMKPHCKVQSSCKTSESVTREERKLNAENEQKVGGFSNRHSSFEFDGTVINSFNEGKTELDQPRSLHLLPGSLSDQSWTDIECDSFLLGLYAFGKNLNYLKRFVGSRSMGDILSFYYGKFYQSEGYSRWSKCRKMRGRRRIYGNKVFIGWRQQELLSRLFSHVSEECQTVLVELSQSFTEGKMPFEEYVFALKDTVGIDFLIAAVGVGKGKNDLTMTAGKPTKTNNIFSSIPKIPIGKACSSLTSAEIIKFLTGDFRLSKARSNDLFWEAVWPRLVAKGWHSKQHKDHNGYSTRHQSCVFLIPDVKKFSRKLVKGNHYFDSISDVLNKVASEPRILEMEIQATEGSLERGNIKAKQDFDGLSNKLQVCYLQHLSSKGQERMGTTVVDINAVSDLDKCELRQLTSSIFPTLSISQETEDQAEEISDKSTKSESSDCTHTHEALDDDCKEEPSSEINQHRFIQNLASDCSKYLPPIMKRQNLTTGKNGELSDCAESTLMDKDFGDSTSPSYHCGESESTPGMSNEGSATENHMIREVSAEKSETRMLFDLNLPPIQPEFETEIELPSSLITLQNIENHCDNASEEGEQATVVDSHHSTRNRLLTRTAFEALEYRDLNSKKKRKNSSQSSSHHDSNSLCFDLNIAATCDDGIDINAMPDTSLEQENVLQACRISIDLNNEPEYSL